MREVIEVDFFVMRFRLIVHYLAFLIVEIMSTVRETARIVRVVRLLIVSVLLEVGFYDSPNFLGVDPFGNLLKIYRSRLLRPLA